MSANLRREQSCVSTVEGRKCLRPARELGGYCTSCYQGLPASMRDTLEWEAKWQIVEELRPGPVVAVLGHWKPPIVRFEEYCITMDSLNPAAVAERLMLEQWLALPCAPDGPMA